MEDHGGAGGSEAVRCDCKLCSDEQVARKVKELLGLKSRTVAVTAVNPSSRETAIALKDALRVQGIKLR